MDFESVHWKLNFEISEPFRSFLLVCKCDYIFYIANLFMPNVQVWLCSSATTVCVANSHAHIKLLPARRFLKRINIVRFKFECNTTFLSFNAFYEIFNTVDYCDVPIFKNRFTNVHRNRPLYQNKTISTYTKFSGPLVSTSPGYGHSNIITYAILNGLSLEHRNAFSQLKWRTHSKLLQRTKAAREKRKIGQWLYFNFILLFRYHNHGCDKKKCEW